MIIVAVQRAVFDHVHLLPDQQGLARIQHPYGRGYHAQVGCRVDGGIAAAQL